MNEAETRAELIDPQLLASGWGVESNTKVLREYHITKGRIQLSGRRAKPQIADYVLTYKGQKLAVIEAKSNDLSVGEGVAQAKEYAMKLQLDYAYSTNGIEIYEIDMRTGKECLISSFPSPDEIWNRVYSYRNEWRDKLNSVPFEDISGTKIPYFYQEIAVNNVIEAIAEEKTRILLTLATGTGKTFIAFQIAWKLFQARWNLSRDGGRRPRILFLTDRNNLANQAFNDFSPFDENAMIRINPKGIRNLGRVPTNGNIFFTIFQTFMCGEEDKPYFGEYPKDYFDLIIIDECHRGGANDESNWRAILEYFAPAVQLGLTATPKRKDNVDTYRYFGEPVYIYSLKEGINDGFLTPFKVKIIQTTLDDYFYVSDDEIIEGEVEQGRIYKEADFNKIIEIKARETKRVKILLSEINQKEKTIVFCATQDHALAIRDLINQHKTSKEPNYCVRVTANDGELGEQYLKAFRNNENNLPTILTSSQKLSTGVDARNIRNIVLLRPINSMIEFKQIIGRGTRLFEGKYFFTVYDFVKAYEHFNDPEWDGEPLEPETPTSRGEQEPPAQEDNTGGGGLPRPSIIRIKLNDGRERAIEHMMSTSFWSAEGKPISAEEFINNLYGKLPEFFNGEDELREIWSNPTTRKAFLDKLAESGYGNEELSVLQKLINAENSDLFDVLEYVSFAITPITREQRVAVAQSNIFRGLNNRQKEFLEFVLSKYIETGVEELEKEKLPILLQLKYQSLSDAKNIFGNFDFIKKTFLEFQKHLYNNNVAI